MKISSGMQCVLNTLLQFPMVSTQPWGNCFNLATVNLGCPSLKHESAEGCWHRAKVADGTSCRGSISRSCMKLTALPSTACSASTTCPSNAMPTTSYGGKSCNPTCRYHQLLFAFTLFLRQAEILITSQALFFQDDPESMFMQQLSSSHLLK